MKVMKKILMMAAIFVVCGNGIVMTSCSKDNPDSPASVCGRRNQPEVGKLYQRGRPYSHLRHGRHLRWRALSHLF